MAGSSSGPCQQLLGRFGHTEFRSKEQKEAVECLMGGGRDIFVSMPTGSGKSLVYQLPAVSAQGKVVHMEIMTMLRDPCHFHCPR